MNAATSIKSFVGMGKYRVVDNKLVKPLNHLNTWEISFAQEVKESGSEEIKIRYNKQY